MIFVKNEEKKMAEKLGGFGEGSGFWSGVLDEPHNRKRAEKNVKINVKYPHISGENTT